jgi:hypothetical protein
LISYHVSPCKEFTDTVKELKVPENLNTSKYKESAIFDRIKVVEKFLLHRINVSLPKTTWNFQDMARQIQKRELLNKN